ncbi:MAG: M3 family metallopeptidase [Betaproteobacteria bacterium AqS2]|uniref:oligopeptidase A n=1 Tax=Candidatus Amphirhobacter heronislandensis TaxID=1732024 RepID=A0A930UIY5_9GAMM|nr:M3 family metallopeptidase [Betaproteobacteria bacterium AqS2]
MSADLTPFGAPPRYAAATPEQAAAAVEERSAALVARAEELAAAAGEPGWDDLVAPLDEACERVDSAAGLVAHLAAVSASPAWDKAHRAALRAATAAFSALGQNERLYARLQQLAAGDGVAPARRRILADTLADFELNGVGLPAAERKQFAKNEERLAELGAEFAENVRKATAAFAVDVAAEAELGEMPADVKAAHRRPDGGWRFGLLDPSYAAFMAYATDRSKREEMARARNARASDLDEPARDNAKPLREILRLRFEQARLLGYANPAAMILTRRMAKEPAAAEAFLADLAARARPAAAKQYSELADFARKELGIGELAAWDLAFAAERYKQAATGLGEAEIRPYFPAAKVIAGLLECLGELFSVAFAPRPAEAAERWHEGVECLAVSRGGAEIGSLYLDLYARPGKQGGAWAHGAQARCRIPGGARQLPAALVNCNFTAPAADRPACLGWQEVVTLFHEAGHAVHHLLTQVDDFCASGMNGVEWDAVELPSQFLENFAWRRATARAMSAHADTGAPLPDELHARLRRQETVLAGLQVTRQLGFARYDLALHQRADAEPLALWGEVRAENSVVPSMPEDRFPCAFTHVFAGGYAAGYYGYLWAQVLAADAYEAFEEPAADLGELGARFCTEVLERGGTRDADENFRAFRGREPAPAPLLRRLGLA